MTTRTTMRREGGGKGGQHRESRGGWLYGRRCVLEALRAGKREMTELRLAMGARRDEDPETEEMLALAKNAHALLSFVERRDIDQLLGDVNHQGVALRAGGYPYGDMAQLLRSVEDDPSATVLVLDHIEDPQNLGSLLRTADAAGVMGVVIPEDRGALVTPAASRASAGAAEHLCVVKTVNVAREIDALKEAGCWVAGLDWGDDARIYTEVDFKGRVALVVGNEGHGIGRLVREKCDFIAQIPMEGRVASLNAAVAGAIAMYEILRQKTAAAGKV